MTPFHFVAEIGKNTEFGEIAAKNDYLVNVPSTVLIYAISAAAYVGGALSDSLRINIRGSESKQPLFRGGDVPFALAFRGFEQRLELSKPRMFGGGESLEITVDPGATVQLLRLVFHGVRVNRYFEGRLRDMGYIERGLGWEGAVLTAALDAAPGSLVPGTTATSTSEVPHYSKTDMRVVSVLADLFDAETHAPASDRDAYIALNSTELNQTWLDQGTVRAYFGAPNGEAPKYVSKPLKMVRPLPLQSRTTFHMEANALAGAAANLAAIVGIERTAPELEGVL